ncbi:hypothetical protein [Pseudomonas cremoricolorata]|uniref:Uncharacterized protein n=1 Tax=Pseudomonas cremoricolorata TaxID=157783 RepID=A0A089WLT6_9PSED|nr:hypothetical protein [Pseudomonas cremoricolorata]AIR89556.1 hypothetical protein LK03_09780 [Pseudomonas cremoricolorata]
MSELDRLKVIDYLDGYFLPLELDVEFTFVTQVDNVLEPQVVESRSLVDEVLHWLGEGEEPTYDPGLVGIFTTPDSFAAEHREYRLRLPDIEKAIRGLLDSGR